jgi:hypothetical protein
VSLLGVPDLGETTFNDLGYPLGGFAGLKDRCSFFASPCLEFPGLSGSFFFFGGSVELLCLGGGITMVHAATTANLTLMPCVRNRPHHSRTLVACTGKNGASARRKNTTRTRGTQ